MVVNSLLPASGLDAIADLANRTNIKARSEAVKSCIGPIAILTRGFAGQLRGAERTAVTRGEAASETLDNEFLKGGFESQGKEVNLLQSRRGSTSISCRSDQQTFCGIPILRGKIQSRANIGVCMDA